MERLEYLTGIYHTIYLISLVAMWVFLIITVVLAIKWRIWEAVAILHGKFPVKGENKDKKKVPDRVKNPAIDDTTEKLWYRQAQNDEPMQQNNSQQEGHLQSDANLAENFGKTEYLPVRKEGPLGRAKIQILDEVIEIHSKERI